MKEEEEKSN